MFTQVLGLSPYEKSCFLNTDELSMELIDLFKAPADVQVLYARHLALLVSHIVRARGQDVKVITYY